MASRMKIEEARVGDVTILRLAGRLELQEGDLVFRDYVNRLVAEGSVKVDANSRVCCERTLGRSVLKCTPAFTLFARNRTQPRDASHPVRRILARDLL